MPLKDLLRAVGVGEDVLEQADEEFPFGRVAEAVLDLRRRYGLTQARLAELAGTSQPVIARLESGSHPAEITLLNKIASAVGERWRPEFEGGQSGQLEGAPAVDEGIEAFNTANTTGDFEEAGRIAAVFEHEELTERRQVARALGAFNAGDYAAALSLAQTALRGELPANSRLTAEHVCARSLLALGRPQDALDMLGRYLDELPAHPLMASAYVQALADSGKAVAAQREADRLTDAGIDEPDLHLHSARAALNQRKPWEALRRILRYRATNSWDIDGMLIHAAALGYIGDLDGATGAHREAQRVLSTALPSGACSAWLLYGIASARLGKWRETLRAARALRKAHGKGDRTHEHDVERLVDEAMVAASAGGPEVILAAADAAARLAPDRRLRAVDRARARAFASNGDTEGVRRALGLGPHITPAAPADRILLARALATSGHAVQALSLLRPAVRSFRSPDDLLFVADTAVQAGDVDLAATALEVLGELEGDVGRAAKLAVAVLRTSRPEDRVRILRLATDSGRMSAGSSAAVWRELKPTLSPKPLGVQEARLA